MHHPHLLTYTITYVPLTPSPPPLPERPQMTDADKDKLRRFLHMDLVAQYVNARLHIDDEAPPDTATHQNTVKLLKLTGTPIHSI